MQQYSLAKWAQPVFLLLILFVTRLHNLTKLPLHNDEGLHLTRAVEVWNLHPFWDISDGKIINHWPIAAFYPQNAADFAARIPTVFVALIGMAGAYALVRYWSGKSAALWASLFWIASPYLFFYERLAQSDAEAGALAVVAVMVALRLSRTGHIRDAVLVGVFISLSALMKLTSAPFALTLTGIILTFGAVPYVKRVRNLLVVGAVGITFFSVPLGYLAVQGKGLFNVAVNWITGSSEGVYMGSQSNLSVFTDQLIHFGDLGFLWPVLIMVGGVALVWYGRSVGLRLLLLCSLPLIIVIAASTFLFPRHLVALTIPVILLAGAGWGMLADQLSRRKRVVLYVGLSVALLVNMLPVMWAVYYAPASLPAPRTVQMEYLLTHSSGVGLREAVMEMPQHVPEGEMIVASMFPASCRRANFYSVPGYTLYCTNAPGREVIEAALNERGEVYMLVEASPLLGIDVTTVDANAEILANYPRPGGLSTVVLYHMTVD